MKKQILLMVAGIFTVCIVSAQAGTDKKDDKKDKKKNFSETMQKLPDMLVAQPDAGVDTTTDKVISDNMYLVVNPVWHEKGTSTFNDFKLNKADEDPISGTLPFPDKKIPNDVVITMNTMKKASRDRKQIVTDQIKTHLAAYYKMAGQPMAGKDLEEKANSMLVSSEAFTTKQGKQGTLYLFNDIQTQQTSFIILLMIPGDTPGTTYFAQFTYTRFIYETTMPDDMMDWRFFVYPDEQQGYVDFTKNILKTLVIK